MDAAEVIVSVDFGTTYSGFAYAHRTNLNEVYTFENWPGRVEAGGGRWYCKTQTSLFYSSGSYGFLKLKAWGWPALQEYMNASEFRAQPTGTLPPQYCENYCAEVIPVLDANNNVGYYITKFKLFLAPNQPDPKLPSDLTVERLVTDYLRAMSEFAMSELKLPYGNDFNKSKIKWCLTVPAIWDEAAKDIMEVCAEKAGMVKGANCFESDASPYPLDIVLEPEAASMYSQRQLHQVRAGDKFLVVDIGGGTIDLALHEKVDNRSLQVREAEMNSGTMGGGTFVDVNFMHLVWAKIEFFHTYSKKDPKVALELWNWWLSRKCTFDGSPNTLMLWSLPAEASNAWKEHDQYAGITRQADEYDALTLNSSELCEIFNSEVSKIIDLIKHQISATKVKCILVVGGFSESKYVINSIKKHFNVEVIVPPNAGAAVIHGAVRLGSQAELVVSRFCKRTYGIKACLPYRSQDPNKQSYDGKDYCNERFSRIVKINQSIPADFSASIIVHAVSDTQREMTVELYSSDKEDPTYVTEVGCVKGGAYCMDISDGMSLGRQRMVEVKMYFGKSKIQVSAKRVNFGNSTPERLYYVKMEGPSIEYVQPPPPVPQEKHRFCFPWKFLPASFCMHCNVNRN